MILKLIIFTALTLSVTGRNLRYVRSPQLETTSEAELTSPSTEQPATADNSENDVTPKSNSDTQKQSDQSNSSPSSIDNRNPIINGQSQSLRIELIQLDPVQSDFSISKITDIPEPGTLGYYPNYTKEQGEFPLSEPNRNSSSSLNFQPEGMNLHESTLQANPDFIKEENDQFKPSGNNEQQPQIIYSYSNPVTGSVVQVLNPSTGAVSSGASNTITVPEVQTSAVQGQPLTGDLNESKLVVETSSSSDMQESNATEENLSGGAVSSSESDSTNASSNPSDDSFPSRISEMDNANQNSNTMVGGNVISSIFDDGETAIASNGPLSEAQGSGSSLETSTSGREVSTPVDDNSDNGGLFSSNDQGSQVEQNAQGGEVEPNSQGGEVEPNAQGGEVEPNAQGGEVEPNAQGGEVEPNAQGGEVEPNAQGGALEPNTQGGELEPNTQGGEVEPKAQGGAVEPNTQGAGAEPNAQGGELEPNTQGGETEPNAFGADAEPFLSNSLGEIENSNSGATSMQEPEDNLNGSQPPLLDEEVRISQGQSGGSTNENKASVPDLSSKSPEVEAPGGQTETQIPFVSQNPSVPTSTNAESLDVGAVSITPNENGDKPVQTGTVVTSSSSIESGSNPVIESHVNVPVATGFYPAARPLVQITAVPNRPIKNVVINIKPNDNNKIRREVPLAYDYSIPRYFGGALDFYNFYRGRNFVPRFIYYVNPVNYY